MRHVRNLRLAIYDCQSELNNLCANARTMLAVIRLSVGRTFLSVHKKEQRNPETPLSLVHRLPDS